MPNRSPESVKKSFLAAAVLVVCAATVADASIAVFTDGRSQKVSDFKVVDEDNINLTLASGGSITVPLRRIDRIVDDEYTPPPPPAVVAEVQKIVAEGVFPRRSWRYSDDSKPIFKTKFDQTIIDAAKKFDVDAALVSAVIKAESDFNPREMSNKGARGLMQLMPATAERFGVTDSFDPVANIYAGTRYLRWLLKTFEGNADLAVAAYNAGEGNVWKYNGVPPFRETVTYINRIAKHIRAAAQKAARVQPAESGVAIADLAALPPRP
jgi:soluble lytic murein transglycosylase-like protein